MVLAVQFTIEIPQFIDTVADFPVVAGRTGSHGQVVDETFVSPQFLLVEKIVARRKLQLPQLQFFMVVHIPVVAQRPFLLVLLFSRPRDSAVPRGYGVRRPCFTGGESSTGAVVEKTVAPTVAPVLKLAAWSSSSR